MPSRPEGAQGPEASLGMEPSQAEIEAWEAHERARREAWLRGRRTGEQVEAAWHLPVPNPEVALVVAQRYARECQLAAEGAVSLLFKTSARDVLDQLVRAGQEWEEEYTSQPVRRRRVALDRDADMGGSSTSARSNSPGASSQPG